MKSKFNALELRTLFKGLFEKKVPRLLIIIKSFPRLPLIISLGEVSVKTRFKYSTYKWRLRAYTLRTPRIFLKLKKELKKSAERRRKIKRSEIGYFLVGVVVKRTDTDMIGTQTWQDTWANSNALCFLSFYGTGRYCKLRSAFSELSISVDEQWAIMYKSCIGEN